MFGDTRSSKHYSQAKLKRSRQHASPRSFLVVSCVSFCQDGLRLFGRAPVAGNPSRTAGRWVCPRISTSVFVEGRKGIPKTRHNDYNLPPKNVLHVYYQKVASPIRPRDVLKRLK